MIQMEWYPTQRSHGKRSELDANATVHFWLLNVLIFESFDKFWLWRGELAVRSGG